MPSIASALRSFPLRQDPGPLIVGERVNSLGSRMAKRALLKDDYDALLRIAREQVEGGAHALDVCVATTERTAEASIIQTRHRIPETPLRENQIIVYQVPIPEPLRWAEPREVETRKMHALGEYGLMHVKLYEDIARFGHIATSYAYPVKVNARYVMDPSPTPKFDNPKMDNCAALQLFGAGREKRIYAIPPYTQVVSLDFEDHPFEPYRFNAPCALCGAENSYLDEIVTDDKGGRMFVCSDTDYCEGRQAAGHHGSLSAAPYKEKAGTHG